jgi:DNA polymerase-1
MATGAMFGFCNMMLKLLRDEKPDYLALCWDPVGDQTFRNRIYPEYKGNRPDMPDELRLQMPYFPRFAEAAGLAHLVVEDFEADDIIGTLTTRFKEQCDVVIVTGDKDMMQLVDADNVRVLDTMKDVLYDPAEVEKKWGVGPEAIVDFLALMGDSSDNIPGVKGIGQKGATTLLQTYGNLEEIFANVDSIKGRNRKPLQAEGARESAEMSKTLATIKCDMEMSETLDDLAVDFPPDNTQGLRELFQELEFGRFLTQLGGKMKTAADQNYRAVLDKETLAEVIAELEAATLISVDTETTSVVPTVAQLVGISFCTSDDVAWYIPVGHTGEGAELQLPYDDVINALHPIFTDTSKQWIGHNIKYDMLILQRAGLPLHQVHGDTLIADYLLNPTRSSRKLDALALTNLGYKMIAYEEVTKDTKKLFAPVSLEKATPYAAEDAHIVLKLHKGMVESLEKRGLRDLYEHLEVPLINVLTHMERVGVLVDEVQLQEYSQELELLVQEVEQTIFQLAGREFKTNSPKQLREILFEELGLPVIKRTKSGPSTDASVLEELASQHELPAAILRYRSLAKLKSTYVDALPPLINPETNRIHTSYQQAVASTGRLSSVRPNMQNIPIRTAEGRRIRKAFIAPAGRKLISADYSQIELRVLAHLCGGEGGFARAFAENKDVHRFTASEVFDCTEAEVTSDMRRTAKAINFGLVYGQSDFGLASSLKITRQEAKDYITRYKAQYPEIEEYMTKTVAFAKENGYVETILGRRRPITDLTSSNHNQRRGAERVAINTPVQGSAADIIKMAMLQVETMLLTEYPEARMLMQVHDELVLEVPEEQAEELQQRLQEQMEQAYTLLVPLKVDAASGDNWDEAH